MERKIREIPKSVFKLFKIIIRAFYSDWHIVTIDILLKLEYISEYFLAKELLFSIEKIRLIVNNLHNDGFLKFEDKLFKQIGYKKNRENKNFGRKIYKLRYWFIDFNSAIFHIKEKIKKIFVFNKSHDLYQKDLFLVCQRKICQKKYSMSDINFLYFNANTKKFTCNHFLNFEIVCGAELSENQESDNNLKFDSFGEEQIQILLELKPIIISFILLNKNVEI